jgi:flagellar basal-body rod protein FlgB
MNEISDSAVLAALRRQMTVAVARQVAAAGNLANVDTPGYRAKEVTFEDVLGKKAGSIAATNAKHLGSFADADGDGVAFDVTEIDGPARRDGNTVQLDRELLTMGKAAGDFAAAQTALAAKFRLVRYAINEGR